MVLDKFSICAWNVARRFYGMPSTIGEAGIYPGKRADAARADAAYSLSFNGIGPSNRKTATPKMPMTVGVIGVRASGPKCR